MRVLTPLPPRHLTALCAIADRLTAARVEWILTGSAGRALLGFPARPADIDLEVAQAHIGAAADALGAAWGRETGAGRTSLRAHANLVGVAIDVTAAFVAEGPGGRLGDGFTLQRQWAHHVAVAGRSVAVAPVEETIARALVLGDWGALAKLSLQAIDAQASPPRAAYVALRLSAAAASAAR